MPAQLYRRSFQGPHRGQVKAHLFLLQIYGQDLGQVRERHYVQYRMLLLRPQPPRGDLPERSLTHEWYFVLMRFRRWMR